MNVNFDIKNTSVSEITPFLEELQKADSSKEIVRIFQSKVENSMQISDISGVKNAISSLKEKVTATHDETLINVFQKTLQVLDSISKRELEEKKMQVFPYYGELWKSHFEAVSEEIKNPGDYIIYSNEVYDSEIYYEIVVATKMQEGDVFHYRLKPVDGGYEVKTNKLEIYSSVEEFIAGRPNRFQTPLTSVDRRYFRKEKSESITSFYFPEMDFLSSVNTINEEMFGTFLMRDMKDQPQGKVILVKNRAYEVEEIPIFPSSKPMGGYECQGKWYPLLSDIFTNTFKENLGLKKEYMPGLEAIEAKEQIAALAKFDLQPPQLKTELYNSYQKRLNEKEEPKELMLDAFNNGHFEVLKWLLKTTKRGDLQFLESAATTADKQKQLEWLRSYLIQPTPCPKSLDHYALTVGYGYKASNLLVQKQYADVLNKSLSHANVEVPPFLPLSDFEMRMHLGPILVTVENLWVQFLQTFAPDQIELLKKGEIESAFTTNMLKAEAKVILSEIEVLILRYFQEHPFTTPELQEWIQENPAQFLIVRSTGKEDTEQNPNPGGNKSVSYVKPEGLEISKAMGEVLSSYFSVKSITQRLMAGDAALFEEKPFLPVLVMNMVTERVNGEMDQNKITRSGVMFTNQKGKADGVTLLQVGLGNNEGVVTGSVAVDTHYIDKQGNIMSVIREKKTRYAPRKDESGQEVRVISVNNNDRVLERQQALPKNVIGDMKKTADFFSKIYGEEEREAPMDIEYTIKDKKPVFAKEEREASMDIEYTIQLEGKDGKPVIHLLQIRPLVEKQDTDPSFLDLGKMKMISKENQVHAQTLLAGESKVLDISPSNVLFADNLMQGLTRYLKIEDGLPKVIFVKRAEALTSHQAIFFRKRGVAVFVVEDQDSQTIYDMIGGALENHPVKADAQRGTIISTNEIEEPKSLEVKGYVSYPIPREISLGSGPFTPRKGGIEQLELKANFDFLNKRYATLDANLKGNHEYMAGKSIRELLDIVATSNEQSETKLALATILKVLNTNLKKAMEPDTKIGRDLWITLLQIFEAAVRITDDQIVPALIEQGGSPNRVYPLKFLDALIFQGMPESVIGSESWTNVMSIALTETKMKEMAETFQMPFEKRENDGWRLQMQKFSILGLNGETKKAWTQFIDLIAKSVDPRQMEIATQLMIEIAEMHLGGVWLNIFFHPRWKEKFKLQGPEGINATQACEFLKELVSFQEKDRNTLNWIKDQMGQLSVMRDNINNWSEPEFTTRNLLKLRRVYLEQFGFYNTGGKPQLVQLYETSSKLGQLAILEFYRQAIEVYDLTVKSVTGSQSYPSDGKQQAVHFIRLLIGYYRMLSGAVQFFSEAKEKEIMKIAGDGWDWNFTKFLTYLEFGSGGSEWKEEGRPFSSPGLVGLLREIQNKKIDPQTLFNANQDFNVEPMTIGSHTDFHYAVKWPSTLEEYFTTLHQNLERIRLILVQNQGVNLDIFEKDVQMFTNYLASQIKGSQMSHVNIKDTKAEVCYSVPLGQHSGSWTISFDADHPEKGYDIHVQVFGANEFGRWNATFRYGTLAGNLNEFAEISKGSPPIMSDRGCSFDLHIPPLPSFQDIRNSEFQNISYCIDQAIHARSNEQLEAKLASIKEHAEQLKTYREFFNKTTVV